MNSTIRRAGALAATAALAFTLASCSGGQSVEEACKVAQDTMEGALADVQSDVQGSLSGLMSGEDVDLKATFEPINSALADADKKVSNKEVKEALGTFITEFESFTGVFDSIDLSGLAELQDAASLDPSDPESMKKIEEMQKRAEEMQTQVQEMQTEMSDKQQGLTDAADKLEKLCN